MSDYLKKAKDKVEGLVKAITGNGGGVGKAKDAIKGRQKRIDDAINEADPPPKKLANGGLVGNAAGGGRKSYGK